MKYSHELPLKTVSGNVTAFHRIAHIMYMKNKQMKTISWGIKFDIRYLLLFLKIELWVNTMTYTIQNQL